MLLAGQVVLGVYGIVLIVGGVMGQVKSGSTVSLAAGGICGLASLVALWVSLSDPAQGFLIGAMLALLLTGIFLSRFFRTRKFMPAGMVLLLSIVVGILLVVIRQRLAV